jgi:hypothetical protein
MTDDGLVDLSRSLKLAWDLNPRPKTQRVVG